MILGALSPFGDVAALAALRLHLDPLDFLLRFPNLPHGHFHRLPFVWGGPETNNPLHAR